MSAKDKVIAPKALTENNRVQKYIQANFHNPAPLEKLSMENQVSR
jgi:hypothetical protein